MGFHNLITDMMIIVIIKLLLLASSMVQRELLIRQTNSSKKTQRNSIHNLKKSRFIRVLKLINIEILCWIENTLRCRKNSWTLNSNKSNLNTLRSDQMIIIEDEICTENQLVENSNSTKFVVYQEVIDEEKFQLNN